MEDLQCTITSKDQNQDYHLHNVNIWKWKPINWKIISKEEGFSMINIWVKSRNSQNIIKWTTENLLTERIWMTKKRIYLGLKIKNKKNPLKFKKIKTNLNNSLRESKISLKITKSCKINNHFKNFLIPNPLWKTIHMQSNLLHHREIHLLILTLQIHLNNHTTDNIHQIKFQVSILKTYQWILNSMDLHQRLSYNRCKVLITI